MPAEPAISGRKEHHGRDHLLAGIALITEYAAAYFGVSFLAWVGSIFIFAAFLGYTNSWLSGKRKSVRYACRLCVAFFIALTVGISTRELTLKRQQDNAYDGLTASIQLPPSRVNLDSTFTIKNESSQKISNHALFCRVLLGVSPRAVISNSLFIFPTVNLGPLEPGGDADSQACISNAVQKSFIPPGGFLSCMDVIVGIRYRLAFQPSVTRERDFRFVSDSDREFVWYPIPLRTKTSPCQNQRFRNPTSVMPH